MPQSFIFSAEKQSVKAELSPNLRISVIEEVVGKRCPATSSILVNSNYLPWKWVADTFAILFAKQTGEQAPLMNYALIMEYVFQLEFVWTQSVCFEPILVSG